jgi:Na+-translocating ferredoxin:NAD+ oxidoreductase RnfC subunit
MTEYEDVKGDTVKGRTKEDILGSIERSNVFGFGGAAFPTIKKIRTAIDANAGECHLIINGVECDPGLIHDKWLLHNRIDNVVNGIRLLEVCLPLSSKTIAVKHDEGLRLPEDISVFSVRDYYPAGAERTLVKDVLKKTLPEDSIPAKQGIIVLNVQTMAAIYEAVCLDRKADTRLITVAKMSDMSGTVARVRLGANMHDVAEKIYPGAVCVHSGGGMMNARMAADDAVIDETVNFIGVGVLPLYRESPLCSKCGYCNAVCPARLNVREIARLVDDGRIESTARLHPQSCMECGSCSHICLAGRNLAARVKKAKEGLKTAVTTDTDNIIVRQETIIS